MEKVLITGVSGQLGYEIYRQLENIGKYEVYGFTRQVLDITNSEQIRNVINEVKPSVVFNCAAMTNVDSCEMNREKAYSVNVTGPENLSVAANTIKAKIVHISTDYVFDGLGELDENGSKRPYIESDKTNPVNVYGKSKLEGERRVEANNPRHFMIRTSWLYGTGENFVTKMHKLGQERPFVKVVNDQYGSPTSTGELARMLIKLIESDYYGLYHGACYGGCSRFELTKAIYDWAGIETKLLPISSDEFPTIAKRPHFTMLNSSKLCDAVSDRFSYWQDALHTYITYMTKGSN